MHSHASLTAAAMPMYSAARFACPLPAMQEASVCTSARRSAEKALARTSPASTALSCDGRERKRKEVTCAGNRKRKSEAGSAMSRVHMSAKQVFSSASRASFARATAGTHAAAIP